VKGNALSVNANFYLILSYAVDFFLDELRGLKQGLGDE
jgi:hypothetical protein